MTPLRFGRFHWLKWAMLVGASLLVGPMAVRCSAQERAAEAARLVFQPAQSNSFTFDTGVLRGTLRAGGRATGLSAVEHRPTGTRLDRGIGLMGHYRVFTANRRYGTAAWDWPGQAGLLGDGSVETHWPANSERPFELRVSYRWVASNALDVVTSVEARGKLSGFESFLACYFAESFSNAAVRVAARPAGQGGAGFLEADRSYGTWLVFPRDAAAMALVRDGRWALPPHPVEWVEMPRLAAPLGYRRSPTTGLVAVLMAPRGDAFALCTPEQTEGHYSMYLSLFGRDLAPGQIAVARARLLILEWATEAEVVSAYERYVIETGRP